MSRATVSFETIKFIRNEMNLNQPINMCREANMRYQEVDEFAASLLIEVLENPDNALNPRFNPFNPVAGIENLNQSGVIRPGDAVEGGMERERDGDERGEGEGRGVGGLRTGKRRTLLPQWVTEWPV